MSKAWSSFSGARASAGPCPALPSGMVFEGAGWQGWAHLIGTAVPVSGYGRMPNGSMEDATRDPAARIAGCERRGIGPGDAARAVPGRYVGEVVRPGVHDDGRAV